MHTPRIAVLGAGANGASIGADLTATGQDVVLIEQWPAHVEAMRMSGLTIESPEGELHVQPRALHLCEVATLKQPFDVVLLVMKAYDSSWAAQLIAPHLAADGIIVALQNGMTTQSVADVVGAERTMGSVIEVSSTMTDPGRVTRHTGVPQSWFAVGAPENGPRDRVDDIAALLRHSGTVAEVDDIVPTKWMKLISNSSLLVTAALLGLPMLDALHTEGMRDVMLRAGQEALDVGRALGHPVLPIFGLTADEIADESRVVEIMLDTLFAGFVKPGATTTVLQDWRKSRRSEAGDLNGHVATEGARLGIPTPMNDTVTDLARRVERGELEPAANNLALLTAALTG
ncbi:MAG TPA: 2-dehydropantoate 2-reductase [Terrimesophilobacter sp.]|nr:2-dehydropantoate 2-reductase [Terrimesophilobacter sp.]HRQ01074.1 2-dehydropantoate 2-reductase [Terrimesophilobacter sp.]